MSEWIEYTGSDEQIAEIKANIHGYIVRDALGMLSSRVRVCQIPKYRSTLEWTTYTQEKWEELDK